MVSFAERRDPPSGRIVLIIEGDADLGVALQAFLEEHGFVALVESNVDRALQTLAAARPQVVLFDQFVPGLDVADFARRVRAAEPPYAVARLFMTTTDDGSADAEHVDAVLRKPFDTDRLILLLKAHTHAVRRQRTPSLSAAQS